MLELEQAQETLFQHGYEYMEYLCDGGFSNIILCQKNQFSYVVKRSVKIKMTEEEINLLIHLNHPNIIKIYDSFEDEFSQYIVMEYCIRGTLHQKGRLSYEQFVYYTRQILSAISFCHSQKIAHRDIKPENIFLDKYDHIKLADFGMAKQFQNNEKSNEKLGSLMFLPPEMLQFQHFDPFKADIWALGVTFFFMATGKYPFKGSTPEELLQTILKKDINYFKYDVHPKIQSLLGHMLVVQQDQRLTAEKLLECPLYTHKFTKLPPLSVEKENFNPNTIKFKTKSIFNADNEKTNQAGDEHKDINQILSLHTYRGTGLINNKLPRVNCRFHTYRK